MDATYYREARDFLDNGGAELAQALPQVAALLAARSDDPSVEELLAGIAFIAAKVGERQEESLDEYCQLLLDVLFPHYLCAVPSATILNFRRLPDADPCIVPRGSEVHSLPVLGTPCRFRTAYDLEFGGLALRDLAWESAGAGARLTIHFDALPWSDRQPQGDRIRLFLHGEPLLTRSLYEALFCRLERADLVDSRGRAFAIPELCARPVGFREEEALFDYPPGSFSGFRLLQEYFSLPEKFLFVEFRGIWQHIQRLGLKGVDRFSLRLTLREDSDRFIVTRDNIRLNCVPAANLFDHSADPIRRLPGKIDYRVRPSGAHLHYETVRVANISAFRAGTRIRPYPLLSEVNLHATRGAFVQAYRRAFQGEIQTYLSVCDGPTDLPVEETLIVDLLASNGQLPRGLGVGDICRPKTDIGELGCQNIIPASKSLQPPLGMEARRRLIRHLVLAQMELIEHEALRAAIELYHFGAFHTSYRGPLADVLANAIVAATTRDIDAHTATGALLGRSTRLEIDDTAFPIRGETYLLGAILNEYVAAQTPINVFSEFLIYRSHSQDTHRWPRRVGPMTLQAY